ncbi:MAG: NAD-dependent epimerase/dehydratase family protein [bacterium]
MIKNKKVLISGATGFIGANLVRRCVNDGAKVYIFTRPTSDKWRINDLTSSVNQYCVDLLDYEKLEKIILDIKPEIIFHTAVYGGYPFQRDADRIIQTNIMGTINLVNACSKVGFDVFVNTGTSSEYGLKHNPMKESDLLEPRNDYGVSKASATLFCQTKARSEKLPIATLRLFSPYGYYEEAKRLVSSVIISCLIEKSPKVSSSKSVRDFVFIEDVMDAYIKTAESKDKVAGQIFNIGFGKQHSVRKIVDEIIRVTGNNVKPELGKTPKRSNEPNVWQADISKAKKELGWQPKYNLDQGLERTINWFKNNIGLYE